MLSEETLNKYRRMTRGEKLALVLGHSSLSS
jgi:hypothetical protein